MTGPEVQRFGNAAPCMGDDLAKSPHMARIGGSVYYDIHPEKFYMDQDRQPSPMMEESVLYRLHSWRLNPRVRPLEYFEEVYTSRHNMVRIYKVKNTSEESKEYVAKHHTYPPALQPTLSKMRAYDQQKPFS